MTIQGLCRVAGLSRQGYYRGQRQRARRACAEEEIVEAVQAQRRLHPRMGVRKLQWLLGRAGRKVGRDQLFEMLRRRDMLVRPKKSKTRTTYRDESLPVYRNLLYELTPTSPNHAWVSDITYIATDEGFVYLALVTDLVSRCIVGWSAAESLSVTVAIEALRRALRDLPQNRWPIHHSDRGSQYCCHEYVAIARERGLPISMTEQNHCYENCYAERVNGIIKDEYNLDACFRTRAQAYRAIEQAVATYNQLRPHCSLDMLVPQEAHQRAA